ncbi:tetratricopeptide repeat protein [Spirosoma sp.]|uniref:tetratricopeptide repeat protein n=1 Tax=Spirosoma sp. TaxID=1899569 RepID=UPI003B3A1B04
MKRLHYVWLLLPYSAFAQPDANRFLESVSGLMEYNRSAQTSLLTMTKRTQARLDTLPLNATNHQKRAFAYTWARDYELAAMWLEEASVRYPKEHGVVGEIYLNQLRDYPRALQHFNAYDALTPNFDDIVSHNSVSYFRGLTYRALGDHTKAIEQFSKAIDSLAIKHGPEWVNYRQYVSRATSYLALQQPEKALIDLDKAQENFNQSALIQYYRGKAFIQLGRISEAQTALLDASFFYKALRAERSGSPEEDRFNPITEAEIDELLTPLKRKP